MRILDDFNFIIEEKTKHEQKFDEVHGANRKLEEKIKRMESEKNKMKEDNDKLEQKKNKILEKKIIELHHAEIVDDYEIKMKKMIMELNALRTKMKKVKTHAMKKDMHLYYALVAIAILIIIIFSIYVTSLSSLDRLLYVNSVAACAAWI